MVISIASDKNRNDIVLFYTSVGEHIRLGENEKVFIAKEKERIVGVVRLINEISYFVLRTFNVLPEKQRQGIGKALIAELISHIPGGKSLYCLPYPHVKRLYEQFGFFEITPGELPNKLRKRYYRYKKKFPIIAMKKSLQVLSNFVGT